MKPCYQINLMLGYGGGEVYTRFFTRALRAVGWHPIVFVHADGVLCQRLQEDGVEVVPVRAFAEIAALLPAQPVILISHTPGLGSLVDVLKPHYWASFAHMPLTGRDPSAYHLPDMVMGVSCYVIQTLSDAGIKAIWQQPMYGIADLVPRGTSNSKELRKQSAYEWDKRKFRDRLMGWVEPLLLPFLPQPLYAQRHGITLAVVSRITPIKQFPLLFEKLVPVLLRYPDVNLEVFGNGGYRSVADLRAVLAPLGKRVRYWGYQADVAAIYRQVDYVLSGLPEKEALGLNLIEAQACGTPVLAVNAPPFTETVQHGVTGWLYADPRSDQGASFGALMQQLTRGAGLEKGAATVHLQQFSESAFNQRVALLMAVLEQKWNEKRHG